MPSDVARTSRLVRLIALLTGLAGILLCTLTPLLPVRQTTATVLWPQGGRVGNITAPLVSGAPASLDVSIPCPVIATMPPSGGLVFATNRPMVSTPPVTGCSSGPRLTASSWRSATP